MMSHNHLDRARRILRFVTSVEHNRASNGQLRVSATQHRQGVNLSDDLDRQMHLHSRETCLLLPWSRTMTNSFLCCAAALH